MAAGLFSVFFAAALPFYTTLAKAEIPGTPGRLGTYLMVQNVAFMCFAFVLGLLADRKGNRLVILILYSILPLCPWSAIAITKYASVAAKPWLYMAVYAVIGAAITLHQILLNYILEYSPKEKHPTYIGTFNSIMAVGAVLPVVLGFLIDRLGFGPVFIGLGCLLVGAVPVAWPLIEVRGMKREHMPRIGA